MKKKITFFHLFVLNQFILTIVILGVIGVYGIYLLNLEQRSLKDKIEPLLAREVDHLNSDFIDLEANAQKLKSIVQMFEFMPPTKRLESFRTFASESLAPHITQYNAFFALGPQLSQRYFGKKSFVYTVHRDYGLAAPELYNSPTNFVAEEFHAEGYDQDPDFEWWAMNVGHPHVNFSDFYFDKGYMEKVMFTTGVGIYDHGNLLAVVGVDTLTGEIAKRMGSFKLGETGGILIADEHGRPVLPLIDKSLPLLNFRYSIASSRDEFKNLPKLSQKTFVLQAQKVQEFQGEDGETYVTLSKQLKGRPWNLVIYQKKSEAYAGMYSRIFGFILSVAIAYIIASFVLFLTGRYVMRREKRAFDDLRESRDAARAATQAKSAFLSTMSHEIRTPLNSMLGSAELLAETSLNSEQDGYLQALRSAGESLLSILNNILDFSKVEVGKMALENRDFLLSDLVCEVEMLIWPPVHRKGLNLQVHVPQFDQMVTGDSLRLKQILLNLLGNAVKFTDFGNIELNVNTQKLATPEKLRLIFEVKDSGVGIAKENLQQIFEEFSQEDSSVTRRFGGSGLGLSISKKIIQLMGGQIHCQSQQFVGSSFLFHVDLPAREMGLWQKTSQDNMMMSLARALEKPNQILVVDDMEENHSLIRAYMKKFENIKVDSAFTGQECLRRLESNRYSLILMDVQMPRMSGLEVIHKIREMELRDRLPRTPIVVISANNFTEDKEKSLKAGADEHCGKPIRKQTVVELVIKYSASPITVETFN